MASVVGDSLSVTGDVLGLAADSRTAKVQHEQDVRAKQNMKNLGTQLQSTIHGDTGRSEGVSMDVNKVLQELKARPGFTDHVGMMLVHNGVVRGWSRKDHAPVSSITVSHDQAKMDAICHEMEQRPGIFAIVAQANGGELQPGDDLLLLVVAGDIRENVKATFAELLDRIKSEAVIKQEFTE